MMIRRIQVASCMNGEYGTHKVCIRHVPCTHQDVSDRMLHESVRKYTYIPAVRMYKVPLTETCLNALKYDSIRFSGLREHLNSIFILRLSLYVLKLNDEAEPHLTS